MKIIPRRTNLECKKCWHTWIARCENPPYCPRCLCKHYEVVEIFPTSIPKTIQIQKKISLEFDNLRLKLGRR